MTETSDSNNNQTQTDKTVSQDKTTWMFLPIIFSIFISMFLAGFMFGGLCIEDGLMMTTHFYLIILVMIRYVFGRIQKQRDAGWLFYCCLIIIFPLMLPFILRALYWVFYR